MRLIRPRVPYVRIQIIEMDDSTHIRKGSTRNLQVYETSSDEVMHVVRHALEAFAGEELKDLEEYDNT